MKLPAALILAVLLSSPRFAQAACDVLMGKPVLSGSGDQKASIAKMDAEMDQMEDVEAGGGHDRVPPLACLMLGESGQASRCHPVAGPAGVLMTLDGQKLLVALVSKSSSGQCRDAAYVAGEANDRGITKPGLAPWDGQDGFARINALLKDVGLADWTAKAEDGNVVFYKAGGERQIVTRQAALEARWKQASEVSLNGETVRLSWAPNEYGVLLKGLDDGVVLSRPRTMDQAPRYEYALNGRPFEVAQDPTYIKLFGRVDSAASVKQEQAQKTAESAERQGQLAQKHLENRISPDAFGPDRQAESLDNGMLATEDATPGFKRGAMPEHHAESLGEDRAMQVQRPARDVDYLSRHKGNMDSAKAAVSSLNHPLQGAVDEANGDLKREEKNSEAAERVAEEKAEQPTETKTEALARCLRDNAPGVELSNLKEMKGEQRRLVVACVQEAAAKMKSRIAAVQ